VFAVMGIIKNIEAVKQKVIIMARIVFLFIHITSFLLQKTLSVRVSTD
jgi:hypothetical protein